MEFQSFDNFDDMLKAIDQSRQAADAATDDYQKTAKTGDCYVREEGGLVIYGELIDIVESEREAGATEEEIDYVRRLYDKPHMANYRFGKHYSVMCPDGEFGDIHVASILQVISREKFEAARAAGWPSDLAEVQTLLNVVPGQEA